MAQLPINVGTPGAGDGDTLRDALLKTNTNFTDVYNVHQRVDGLSANVARLTANNTGFVSVSPASSIVNSTHLAANLSNYWTQSQVVTAISTRTANSAAYIGTLQAANVVSITTLNSRLNSYSNTSQVLDAISTRTSNSAAYIGTLQAANVVSNTYLNSQLSSYVTSSRLTTEYSNNTQLTSALSYYQLSTGLSANVVKLTANNTSFLGGVAATNYISTSGNYSLSGQISFTNNVILSKALYANGSYGTSGQVLVSGGIGGNTYWATVGTGSGSITSIVASNGINGGTISDTGTISIKANTGIIANTSGVFVDAAYVNTISANSAAYLGTVAAAGYQTTAGLSANVAKLTSNSASFLGTIGPNEVVTTTTLASSLSFAATRDNARLTSNVGINNTAPVDTLSVNGTTYLGGNVQFTKGIKDTTGSFGSAGAFLTSNGSSNVYWSTLASYSGVINATSHTTGSGYGTSTVTGGAVVNTTHIAVGNSTTNVSLSSDGVLINGVGFAPGGGYYKGNRGVGGTQTNIANIFRINGATISNNITIVAGENAQATGPIVINPSYTLSIQPGGRAVII